MTTNATTSSPKAPITWFEVTGQDVPRLQTFYSELVGWTFDNSGPMNYGLVACEDSGVPGGVGEAKEGKGWSTFYVEVADLEATVGAAVRLGGSVLMPATKYSDHHIAVIADPEGHPVGLVEASA